MVRYEAQPSWKLRVNAPRTWREHVGQTLRDLAELIDGQHSLAVHITSCPPIGYDAEVECIKAAVSHLKWAINDGASTEAREQILVAIMKDRRAAP